MYVRNRKQERGQGLVEYAMILSLVAIAVIIALVAFGDSLTKSYKCVVITMEALGNSPISGFMLVDTATDTDLTWMCGQNLSRGDMPANVTIRTHAASVGSVRLSLSGPTSNTRVENIPPYSLWGDTDGDFAGQSLAVGDYTLTATAYSESGAGGTELGSLSIEFTIQA